MSTTRPCSRTRLATSAMVTIEACSCAMVHLNIGATTMRFTPGAFAGLSALIGEAVAELARRGTDEASALRRGRPLRGEA